MLGKKVLICIGDAENDISMLDAADYAFCPSDGILKDRYPNVCACGDGAIGDVISLLETGRYNPSIFLAYKVAKLFGMTIEEVFIFEDAEQEESK